MLDGEIDFDKPVEDVNEITLAYSQRSFIIDFVAFDYDSFNNIQYAYKLVGFDEEWRYCSNIDSFTKFTNLDSGEYTFLVKAANSDGVWSEDVSSLKITIMSPFWQSWWFILSLCLISLLIVVMFIKFRTHVLNTYAQKLKVEVGERNLDLIIKTKRLEHANKLLEEELNNRVEFTHALVHELKNTTHPTAIRQRILMNTAEDDITLGFVNNIAREP